MSNKHLELLHLSQDKNSETNPSSLLSQGANPNIRDPFYHKWTPLHYAVSLNKEQFALQLLNHPKTNATLVDSDGFSPLYWAAKKGSSARIISALLSKGCDPNERDMHGMTALFAAVASNKEENVSCLVSHPSIDVNQPNQFGGSALHHTAFATDNIELADILVNAGANLFLLDHEKQTPLHVAKRRNRNKLFKYFKSKMEEEEPSWRCDVSLNEESETSINSADDEDHKESISVAPDIKTSSSHSIISALRQSHSTTVCDKDKERKEKDMMMQAKQSKSVPVNAVTAKPQSRNIHNNVHPQDRWHAQHQQRMKQVKENKYKIVKEIEQAGLNKEAKALLQKQQIHFQSEHELFYSSLKHEYDKLHYQRDHYMNLSKQLIQRNSELKQENIKLKMQLKYMKMDNMHSAPIARKKVESKHQKEFKKWFKREIGSDFVEYYNCFVRSGFDDLRTIRYITREEQLIDLGIDKKGHRLHILDKIETYRLSTHQMHNNEVALAAYPSLCPSPNINAYHNDDAHGVEGSEGSTET